VRLFVLVPRLQPGERTNSRLCLGSLAMIDSCLDVFWGANGNLRPYLLAEGGGAARWRSAGYLFLVPGEVGCLRPWLGSSIARGLAAKEGAIGRGGLSPKTQNVPF